MENAEKIEKSIFIKNDTTDAKVTLFVYPTWDPICWLPYLSKIIEPGNTYLHRSKRSFKFELRAHGEKSNRKIIRSLEKWEKPDAFIVTGCVEDSSVKVEEKSLADFPQENQICIRRQNMEKEISVDSGRNLYEILKLDMKNVRKMKTEKQNEMIKEAFHREIRRWHPDRPQGDENICQEIIIAYSYLGDPEKRATYNNMTDYDNGWLSLSRWKSIFWPDCNSKEQTFQYRKRMILMAYSLGLFINGVLLTISGAGSLLGAGMIGAAMQSGLRTVNHVSIASGCDVRKYLMSMVIGAATGGLLGGVAVGGAAFQATEMTVAATTEATVGAIAFVAGDLDKKFVDREDISWKKIACHALIGLGVGAAAGVAGVAAGAAVRKVISARVTNTNGEAIEQLAFRAGKIIVPEKHAKNAESCIKTGTVNAAKVLGNEFVKCSTNTKEKMPGPSSVDISSGIFCSDIESGNVGIVRYISEGAWESKLIVQYTNDKNEVVKKQESGSGSSIQIPENAKYVKVRFQVLRFIATWCDVKKYNRFKECWSKPTEPHIFKYDKPTIRTFTISGGLYYEAVMKVTDEYYNEVCDM